MSVCAIEEREAGRGYPRTCPTCKLAGPCVKGLDRKGMVDRIEALTARADQLESQRNEAAMLLSLHMERAEQAEAENAKLRAEVERLRGVVAQCRGMADEGADAYLAAYRWCERIEEVCAAGEPLEEYEQWAWKPALREGGE